MPVIEANGQSVAQSNLTSASGASSYTDWFVPERRTDFNIFLSGTGVGTVVLELSPDKGVTVFGIYAAGEQLYTWNYTGTNLSEVANEPESDMYYRLRCTSYTSGTITARLSK